MNNIYIIFVCLFVKCYILLVFVYMNASVDTEMCFPKGKCGCQYFILLTLKKNHGDRGPGYFLIKKTNPGLLFLLKVRSCVFISNFHHSLPPSPSQGIYNCIVDNKLINNKFRFSI